MKNVCETGPLVYRPYPRRLESLIICRCHYRQHFLLSYFKTQSVGPAGIRIYNFLLSTPALSQLSLTGGGVDVLELCFNETSKKAKSIRPYLVCSHRTQLAVQCNHSMFSVGCEGSE